MIKKITIVAISTLLMASLLIGCSRHEISGTAIKDDIIELEKDPKIDNDDNIKPVDEYITNEYSVQHSAEIIDYLSTGPTDNIILSETSLNMALSMLLEGAEPNSDAYNDLIGYLDESVYENDIDNIRLRNNWLVNSYSQNDSVTLSLANSVWANNNYSINPLFENSIQTYYNGVANTANFMDQNTVFQINQWCSDNTNGCIRDVVDSSLLANNECLILNALYFNGLWEEPFENHNCIEDEFTNADGSISMVNMMHDYDAGLYYSNDQAEAFMRYYDGHEIAFVGILPKDENFNVTDLDIDRLLESGNNNYTVHAIMPSFVVEDKNSLLPVLNTTIPNAMCTSYNGILNEQPTNISEVIQMTYVDVNPEGTEAAAVTVIGNKVTSVHADPLPMIEINLNRPFVFMIYDTVNHEVLFMGRINQL